MGEKRGFFKTVGRKYLVFGVAVVLAAAVTVTAAVKIYDRFGDSSRASCGKYKTDVSGTSDSDAVKALGKLKVPSYVKVDYLDIGNARSGVKLTAINNIVIHYTGNPGTTARQNRSYFGQKETVVCSHFLIGLEGEIIQCLPLDEKSAASNDRNPDTVSIEICHPDATGKFNEETYRSAVKLAAWLCRETGLDSEALIRHHDITGKSCPKYFVDHPEEWTAFKAAVADEITKEQ